MNVLFNDCLTVYNYHRDDDTDREIWTRHVIPGIMWRHNRKEVITGTDGIQKESRTESITIDFERSYGRLPYLTSREYKQLDAAELPEYWTLDAKGGHDVLVQGECLQEITYGYRVSDLIKDYDAVKITAVSDYRGAPMLKHIKVVAR